VCPCTLDPLLIRNTSDVCGEYITKVVFMRKQVKMYGRLYGMAAVAWLECALSSPPESTEVVT
jgi:hypothetical protein